jgi:transmembrane sensor
VSVLETPIKEHLRELDDPSALDRIWSRIDGRALEARRRRRGVAFGGLALAACAATAFVLFARRDAGPLRFADGRALAAVEASAAELDVAFSDGSSVELAPGARFEPLESTGTSFIGVLQRGRASFEVKPGGPRRWQVECGLATVEVVGTRFSCDRAPGRLRVAVTRGAVLVRGERVADRARRLAAGEAMEIVDDDAVAPSTADPLPPPSSSAKAVVSAPASAPAPWRELARRGRHEEAFAAVGAQSGVRRETPRLGVADLLALADVARLSGHPRDAVMPLERILSSFSRDPQAPLAAFALARLELDALDRPRRAVAALERALALGTPAGLREDVRARLVEALARSGDDAGARRAARAYLSEFPYGRYRVEMETRL